MKNLIFRMSYIFLFTFFVLFKFPGMGIEKSNRAAFQKGFSYLKWGRDFVTQSPGEMEGLAQVGATYVSIVPVWYQNEIHSTGIVPHGTLSPTMNELRIAIQNAKNNNLKVLLKPHVDVIQDHWSWDENNRESWLQRYRDFQLQYPIPREFNNGNLFAEMWGVFAPEYKSWFDRLFPHWRGEIGPYWEEGKEEWLDQWFGSYRNFILQFAQIAKEEGVEYFCVATELRQLHEYSNYWERIIREVRGVLDGTGIKILYHANHDDFFKVKFWDKVDFIGISAYYPLSDGEYDSVDDLKKSWNIKLDTIEEWLEQNGYQDKPVLFTEVGYVSLKGTTRVPWEFKQKAPIDEQEQADAYEATLSEIPKRPWLHGLYFWRWTMQQNYPQFNYDFFTPFNKKAAVIVKRYWQK